MAIDLDNISELEEKIPEKKHSGKKKREKKPKKKRSLFGKKNMEQADEEGLETLETAEIPEVEEEENKKDVKEKKPGFFSKLIQLLTEEEETEELVEPENSENAEETGESETANKELSKKEEKKKKKEEKRKKKEEKKKGKKEKAADALCSNASTASLALIQCIIQFCKGLFAFCIIPDAVIIIHINAYFYLSIWFSFAQEAHSLYMFCERKHIYRPNTFCLIPVFFKPAHIPFKCFRITGYIDHLFRIHFHKRTQKCLITATAGRKHWL